MEKLMTCAEALQQVRTAAPRIHCLANAVTMNDVANVLLAIGGSAIMAQDTAEAEEITAICHGTLLNTGTPDNAKFKACKLAGKQANRLGHPVVLDPVGAGASRFRRENLKLLLHTMQPNLIRCNLEEAVSLLSILSDSSVPYAVTSHGGVESGIAAKNTDRLSVAAGLSQACRATVFLSGPCDAISDGTKAYLIHGGDARITRITGSGCMLSAVCAAFLAAGLPGWQAAIAASRIWKYAAGEAGRKTDGNSAGIGSFHVLLLDIIHTMDGIPEDAAGQRKGGIIIEDFSGCAPPLCGVWPKLAKGR